MDPGRLISDYLDNALTSEETAELFTWIRRGGDGNACDWVHWTHPELVIRSRCQW
jgi:hypothetical protein